MVQQAAEGDVLAPEDGRVLTVPVTRGAVILAGEPVATIGSGGLFLRLAVPERHAAALKEGDSIRIGTGGGATEGRLAKVYPEIEGGRVTADVEVDRPPGRLHQCPRSRWSSRSASARPCSSPPPPSPPARGSTS